MGRFVLILVGAAAVLGALSLHHGAGTSAQRAVVVVADHGHRAVAREIALSGHAAAVRAVRLSYAQDDQYVGPGQYAADYQGGSYTSHVTIGGDEITIATRAAIGETSYVIRESYVACDNPKEPAVPDFMVPAVVLDNDFHITGTANITSPPGLNANIHTNRRLTGQGSPSVSGFGSYSTTVGNLIRLNQIFSPNENPDGAPRVLWAPPKELPVFDTQAYKSKATVVTEGNLSLSDAVLGTRSNPVIWYVAGDLTANGGRLSGYGIFIVEGQIRVNGQVEVDGAICGDNESNVAFYATGNVTINGGATLRGQVFAGGDARMNGTAVLYGNVAALGQTDFSGSFTINYRYASSALTDPIWPGPPGAPGILVRTGYVEGG